MKKVFLSFADSKMHRALNRIKRQALNMQVYDEAIVCNETNLSSDFREKFKDKLVPGSRGYGYWCWKPQIILQTLEKLNDGDILTYCDAGCHFNERGKKRLIEYFDIVTNDKFGILAFQGIVPIFHDGRKLSDLADKKWCKGDLLDHLGMRDLNTVTNSQTIGAGIIFFKKNSETMNFIEKWIKVFSENFSLIDDTPSKSANLEGFIEHRHDQAIFSLLCKLNNVKTISAYEYWYPRKENPYIPDWSALKYYPIHARRDKTSYSKFHTLIIKITSLFKRVIRKLIHR